MFMEFVHLGHPQAVLRHGHTSASLQVMGFGACLAPLRKTCREAEVCQVMGFGACLAPLRKSICIIAMDVSMPFLGIGFASMRLPGSQPSGSNFAQLRAARRSTQDLCRFAVADSVSAGSASFRARQFDSTEFS